VVNFSLVDDPTIRQPGFNLRRQQWSLLDRFRTAQGYCGECKRKWNQAATDLCPCGVKQTVSHIVEVKWRLVATTLCWCWSCCLADQLWLLTHTHKKKKILQQSSQKYDYNLNPDHIPIPNPKLTLMLNAIHTVVKLCRFPHGKIPYCGAGSHILAFHLCHIAENELLGTLFFTGWISPTDLAGSWLLYFMFWPQFDKWLLFFIMCLISERGPSLVHPVKMAILPRAF